MKQKYPIKVAGADLTILTDEPEEYVYGLAKLLDRRINDMVVNNKKCSRLDAAVLCALEYLDVKIKSDDIIEGMKKEIEELKSRIEG